MAGMPLPTPFAYYHHHPPHSMGQFRSPYAQIPMQMNAGPSMQSMTSHWNLIPPSSTTPPHSVLSMNRTKNMNQTHSPGVLKPPKAPEKPLLPYMRYSRKMWEQFKKTEGSELKVWEVGKIIGQKWRELSDEEKQPYFDEYEAEKSSYDETLRGYKNSLAYKQYLEAKKIADRQGSDGYSSFDAQNRMSQFGQPPPSIITPPRHSATSDPRLMMLQQEEDEEDEYVTTKQVSAARYHRNHKLMAELFGDAVVPDMRVSVTNSRLESLKMQSNSLALHQKRLQTEVEQMEIKYGEKRAQILEEAERFRRELKRIQENPPITWKKPPVQLSPKDIPESLPSAKYTKL